MYFKDMIAMEWKLFSKALTFIHTHRFLGYINVNKEELEASASGLQHLSEIENLNTSERQIIARRYYRLGEWMAILQGSEWLKVYKSLVRNLFLACG